MKKALSLVLTMCIVLSLFATFVVSASAEDAVVSLGATYTSSATAHDYGEWAGCSQNADKALTDGEKATDNQYMKPYNCYSGENVGYDKTVTITLTLDKVYAVTGFNVYTIGGGDGSANPLSVSVSVSSDNQTWSDAVTATSTTSTGSNTWGHNYTLAKYTVACDAVNAQYVKYDIVSGGNQVFVDEVEVIGSEVASAPVLTWKDGWVNDPADDKPEENGQDLIFNNAYDYTFNINYVDGVIAGEDNTLITNQEKYLACNPNWAVSVLLAPTATAGTYEVVTVVMNPGDVAKNGLPEGINFDNGNIVLVAHSAYSNDLGTNYTSKLCALALKVGDKVVISEDKTTAYVPVPGGNEPEVIVETITVDGDLSDTGWLEDGWVTVTPDNGYWQGIPTTDDTISYKYQLRTDDTKLYAAFVIDCAGVNGGNGTGTNVRFWINSDSEYKLYTHFYDVFLTDGAAATGAKYNTAKDANSGAVIENSTINAVVTTADGKTYVEFSVDLAEFGGEDGFNYFICVSNKVNENVCLYYPAVVAGQNEDGSEDRQANLPYKAWYTEGQATVDVEAIKLGEVVVEDGETDDDLGDAGIYAIAALAVVALIGTAVVIKRRA